MGRDQPLRLALPEQRHSPRVYWFGFTEKSSTTRFCPERGGEKLALDEPPPGCDIKVAVTL